MGILLSGRGLSKTFGSRPLFEGLSFGLFEGERTGLIGPNGAGKSTLLKILAGLETPDDGELSVRRGLRVRYLAQKDVFSEAELEESVQAYLKKALHEAHLEDYEVEMRVEEALAGSGFNPEQRLGSLSGGWRKRLAILSHTACQPDLFLLDEPTNHLDLEGVQWLERFLLSLSFSFLMITHDRRFLESVCNRVIELNKRYPEGHFSCTGHYSDFIESRENLWNAQKAQEASTRNIVRREIEWLRRGPKARTTKQKARIDRAGELIGTLADMEFRSAQDRSASIAFTSRDRQSKKLVEALKLEKSMGGRKLFGPLDLLLSPGRKLGLLGGNGSGKSTLLKLIAGTLAPDAGTLKRADGLNVIVFDQGREQLDPDMSLRRALCSSGEFVHYQGRPIHIVGWAERFLFAKEQLEFPLSRLSGGEQARVLIARLMLKPADVLLLDEPTNDLDIQSLEVLESSLQDFSGALVLVTHDRYLLDRVSDEILYLNGKGQAVYYADLAQWEDAQTEDDDAKPLAPSEPSAPKATAEPKRGLSAPEAKELRRIEAEIRRLETTCEQAKEALADPTIASQAAELLKREAAIKEAQAQLDALLKQWEVLEARR